MEREFFRMPEAAKFSLRIDAEPRGIRFGA
jgi:hypothetical protein